ncbi:unnamed protein product [Caenorhabditis bovis]|uniref:ZP domain-containing protein n=1 Tax=Caenorhabditis bovis TaxID=2654633 RepID=A0A8S1F3P4_9PELO|nr:unnamed protein product [Caenorhabditis bovis]
MRLLILVLFISVHFSYSVSIVDTSIACDKADFLLKIKFDEIFHGTIRSRSNNPRCIYVNGTIQPDSKYQLKIPLKGCSTRENEEGNLENEIEVVSSSSSEFDVENDKRFLLTCIPAAPVPKESLVTVSFGGITINNEATTASTISENRTVDYAVKVLDGDSLESTPLTRPLAVGDKVTYSVEMDESVNGRIGKCWANDGVSELPLSDAQGCSLQSSGEVWGDFSVTKKNGKRIFYNHIKAWAFPTSNEVNIFCNLHVCVTCTQPNCRGRERRHPSDPRDPFTSDVDVSDISPPIPIRTSFRLKRENTAKIEKQAVTSSSSSSSSSFLSTIALVYYIIQYCYYNN